MNIHRGTSLLLGRMAQRSYQIWSQLKSALFPPESDDYLKWRHDFLHKRLGFGLWIGLICFLISSSHGLYIFLFEIEQIRADFDTFYGEPWLADQLRDITIIGFFVIVGLILGCLLIHKTHWGRRYPAVVFLLFASAVNGFTTQLISTFYEIPIAPTPTVFLAFAVLLPLCWPLHLFSQLLPITYYTVVLPILGFTEVGNTSIFDSVYSLGTLIEIAWVCLICNAGVLVYERLRLSEFESRRELQIFLHAISHDLRNPVMGTSVVIKNVLRKATEGSVQVSAAVFERLLQGSDRQLALINALIEAYHADGKGMMLKCQPLQLSTVVDMALSDIESKLNQNKVQLRNSVRADLPLVYADPTHLWRVWSNLMDNALKHNPPGIQLTLNAEVIEDKRGSSLRSLYLSAPLSANRKFLPKAFHQATPSSKPLLMLLCQIQDNGIGIPDHQRQRLFELYTRGTRARYMPGLGLGLYLCRQIITAHGGDIGVISQPGEGSTFWFTLPLAPSL